jgi:branched-chain amino acid transport system substrate-binding protein
MNKNTKRILAIVGSSALAMGAVVSTSAQAAGKTVTLVFQGPLTGANAQAGVDEFAGFIYAVKEYNKTSKVQVKYLQADDQGDGSVAAQVAPGIAQNKAVIGLVGSAFSGATVNSVPFYRGTGLTMISPSASRVSITAGPTVNGKTNADSGFPVFHRTVAKDSLQGPALAAWAIKGVTAPVVKLVDDQSPYGAGLCDEVTPTLKTRNASSTRDSILPTTSTDWSAETSKVLAAKANVVIYCGYDADAGHFVKSLRDGGYTGIFAAGDGVVTSTFPTTAGKAAEGARLTEADTPFQNIATAAQLAAFTADSGVKTPGGYVTGTIDATNAFLQCITEGKLTRPAIANCVNTDTFKSVAGGTFNFLRYGDTAKPAPVGAFTVKSGDITYVGNASTY